MKHRYVSRDTRRTTQEIHTKPYIIEQRSSHDPPLITMPDKRIHLHRVESRSDRSHSIASLSWMESVPYWLKQHERHELLEHVYTNLRFFFFLLIFLLLKHQRSIIIL